MSWETQGRQYHAWFGHGTADQDGPAAAGKGDVVAAVISGAAGLMPGERRAAFEHYLASGGQAKLEKAIPIWAASSGMSAVDFRERLVGGGLGDEGALALQAMGRSLAGSTSGPDVAGASGQLAAAVTSASSVGWRYGLSLAGSQAIYAEANGLAASAAPGVPLLGRVLAPALRFLGGVGAGVAGGVVGGILLSPSHLGSDDTTVGRPPEPGAGTVVHSEESSGSGSTDTPPGEATPDLKAGAGGEQPPVVVPPGSTAHGEQRRAEARTDPHRDVGDPERVRREGRRFTDSETGYTIYVDGDRVVIDKPDGANHSRMKNPRANTQQRIRIGKWLPTPKQ